MRRVIAVLLAFMLSFALTSCSTGPSTVTDAETPDDSGSGTLPANLGSGAGDGLFPRDIRHFGGSTTVEAAPLRVAAISTGQLDGLLTLGLVPVGTTTARGADLVPEYLRTAFSEDGAKLTAMATLGTRTEPDLEAVAAADPDLILTNSTVEQAIRDQFAQIAPVVVTEGTGVNWKQDFLLLADAVGKRQAAEDYLAEFLDDARALGEQVSGEPTVSLTSIAPDRVRIFGVASFAGTILEDANLERPAAQDFADTSTDVSLETLDQASADWIFYGVQGRNTDVTASSVWAALPAVAAGKAVAVDYDTWYLNAGPTAARSVVSGLQQALGS